MIEVVVPEPPMGCSLALSDRGALCTVEAVQPASRAAGAGVREGDVSTCVEINQCVGCSSTTRPCWLRRAVRKGIATQSSRRRVDGVEDDANAP